MNNMKSWSSWATKTFFPLVKQNLILILFLNQYTSFWPVALMLNGCTTKELHVLLKIYRGGNSNKRQLCTRKPLLSQITTSTQSTSTLSLSKITSFSLNNEKKRFAHQLARNSRERTWTEEWTIPAFFKFRNLQSIEGETIILLSARLIPNQLANQSSKQKICIDVRRKVLEHPIGYLT
jgi:hypothetical protein